MTLLIAIARKPTGIGSMSANTVRYGCGGINVDATRIGVPTGRPLRVIHPLRDDVEYHPSSLAGRVDGTLGSSKAVGSTTTGRWPANMLLQHCGGCQKMGTTTIKGTKTHPLVSSVESKIGFASVTQRTGQSANYGDPETGMESMAQWECLEGCPVGHMDSSTGVLTSGKVKPGYMRNNSRTPHGGGYEGGYGDSHLIGFGDSGGASRFFKQVRSE